jgi:hypothetical protein
MNNQQLQKLQQLLLQDKVKRGRKKKQKSLVDFPQVEAELRQRYGSLTLALELVGITKGEWQARRRANEYPTDELYLVDYLLTNDLKSLTGIDVPDDYRQHAFHRSSVRLS